MKVRSYIIRSAITHFRKNLKKFMKCEEQTEEDLLRKWWRYWMCYITKICESFQNKANKTTMIH